MNTPADDWLLLSEPDIGTLEPQFVQAALQSPRLSNGAMVQRLERSFAQWLGREHAVAVASGTLGTWLALRALGIGPGDEVIAPAHGWHQVAHAVVLAGARVVFADIDYWSGCLDPARAAARVTLQAGLAEPAAALALAQLTRIDEILERRKAVEAFYIDQMQSFEGIKPPYRAPDVDEVHWMLYVVHLGKRFTASALAVPLHGHLDAEQVQFIVQTLKDSSINVGAGAAIY